MKSLSVYNLYSGWCSLVSLGCCNRAPQAGQLQQQMFISLSGGWKSKRVLARWGSGEDPGAVSSHKGGGGGWEERGEKVRKMGGRGREGASTPLISPYKGTDPTGKGHSLGL